MLRDQGEKIGNFDPTDNLEKLRVSVPSQPAQPGPAGELSLTHNGMTD